MDFSRKTLISLLISIFVVLSLNVQTLDSTTVTIENSKQDVVFSNDYPSGLEILSDTDFVTLGFKGNGSEVSPYLIQDLEIIIESSFTGLYIRNTRMHCIVQNCTIIYGFIGIHLWNTSNVVVMNNTVNYCPRGIVIDDSSNIKILENDLWRFTQRAMSLSNTPNIIVENNLIQDAVLAGVSLEDCPYSLLNNNTLTNCLEGITLNNCFGTILSNNTFVKGGVSLNFVGNNLTHDLSYELANNTLNSKKIGLFKNSVDLRFEESNYSQLIFINCTNVLVSGLDFANSVTPIVVYRSRNVEIRSCTIFDTIAGAILMYFTEHSIVANNDIQTSSIFPGVFLSNCIYCLVQDNNIVDCTIGIYFLESPNCNALSNICQANYYAGISVVSSSKCEISNNIISETINLESSGIGLGGSSNCLIAGNSILKNQAYGIRLASSLSNEIVSNSIVENIRYGVLISLSSSHNVIYWNEFIDNYPHRESGIVASQAYDSGSDNQWYSTTHNEGNYWSDRNRRKQYPIDGDAVSKDPYPLGKSPFKDSVVFPFISLAIALLVVFRIRKKRM